MTNDEQAPQAGPAQKPEESIPQTPTSEHRSFFGRNSASDAEHEPVGVEQLHEDLGRPTRWSMGVLNDPFTHEVPGKSPTTSGRDPC